METDLPGIDRKTPRKQPAPGEHEAIDWEEGVEEESEDSLSHDVGVFLRERGSAGTGLRDD